MQPEDVILMEEKSVEICSPKFLDGNYPID